MLLGQFAQAGQIGQRRRGVDLEREQLELFQELPSAVSRDAFAPNGLRQGIDNFQWPNGGNVKRAA